jgi:hypothetical protein
MATQGSCNNGQGTRTGWELINGSLVAPGGLCMVGDQHSGAVNMNRFSCPPATTSETNITQCGWMLFNCSAVSGQWSLDHTGQLHWGSRDTKGETKCLATKQGIVASDRNSSRDSGPHSATMVLQNCAQTKPDPSATFSLQGGVLKVGTGDCIGVGQPPGVQLWSKPMSASKVAFLVLNPLSLPQKTTVALADVPHNPCKTYAASSCALRDVWAGKDMTSQSGTVDVSLAPHESMVYMLSASTP